MLTHSSVLQQGCVVRKLAYTSSLMRKFSVFGMELSDLEPVFPSPPSHRLVLVHTAVFLTQHYLPMPTFLPGLIDSPVRMFVLSTCHTQTDPRAGGRRGTRSWRFLSSRSFQNCTQPLTQRLASVPCTDSSEPVYVLFSLLLQLLAYFAQQLF